MNDVRTSLRELGWVMSQSPEDMDAAFWYSMVLGFVGRMPQAREVSDHMMKVDPLNTNAHLTRAWWQFLEGRFDDSVATIHGPYQREPNMWAAFVYGQALIHAQRWDEMDAHAETLRAELASAPLYRLLLAQVHAHRGERKEVESLIDDELMKTVSRDLEYPWQLAIAWLLLGERDRALALLEDAVSRGFWNHRFLGELDPYLAPLCDDPRFVALIAKAKAEAEQV